MDVSLTFQKLEKQFHISRDNPEIVDTAERTLDRAKNILHPKALYQWVAFNNPGENTSGYIVLNSGDHLAGD